MPKEELHPANINTISNKINGERVAQRMGVDIYAYPLSIFLNNRVTCHRLILKMGRSTGLSDVKMYSESIFNDTSAILL